MTDLYLGIDAGSTVLKAAVFDNSGHQRSIASCNTPLERSGSGCVEADPLTCLAALDKVIHEVVQSCGDPSGIAAIGICGAMVGAWLVDKDGRAVRPGINWEDSRSQPLLDAMAAERPTLMSDIFSVSGSVLQQGCTLPLLAWLKQQEPDTLKRTAYVLNYKDFLRHHLTGKFAIERSEAAVHPGDAHSRGHSRELIELFALSDLVPLFPELLNSEDIAGYVTAEAADRTGLPIGIPVIAGAGDVIANVIGAGSLKSGATTAILGTTCMVGVCHTQPIITPPDLGLLFSLPENHWYRAMVNVAGTLNLDWIIRIVAPELTEKADRFARISRLVESSPAGANGITYLPYLSESGIIAPVFDPLARAQFSGLHAGHTRADIVRSVYEGVVFALANLIDLLGPDQGRPVTLTGGGSRSALWCQMLADVTCRPVLVPAGVEFGALGAALIAATSVGQFGSVAEASAAMSGSENRYMPVPGAEKIWSTPRSRFTSYRDRLLV